MQHIVLAYPRDGRAVGDVIEVDAKTARQLVRDGLARRLPTAATEAAESEEAPCRPVEPAETEVVPPADTQNESEES